MTGYSERLLKKDSGMCRRTKGEKMGAWINKNTKYIFTLPTLIFIILLIAYPMYYTLRLSFYDWGMSIKNAPEFIGLDNYKELLIDPRFWSAFGRTIAYTAAAVSLETFFGVIIGLMLGKIKKGVGAIRTIFLMPMVATPVAVGIIWKLIYDPTIGLANNFLKWAGLPTSSWFGNADTVFSSLIIMDVWEWTPMITLMVFAGVSGLSSDVFESAKVDGATEFQTIRKIKLPLLMPTILMAVLLRMIDALKTFDQIYSTTGGGPGYSSENLNILTYRNAFEYFYMGKACALLVIFFTVVLGVALIYSTFKKKVEGRYE